MTVFALFDTEEKQLSTWRGRPIVSATTAYLERIRTSVEKLVEVEIEIVRVKEKES